MRRIVGRAVVLSACAVGAAVIASIGLACGGNPAVPTVVTDPCLSRAVFGPAAGSAYVLPYPVGSAYMVLQSYCLSACSHGDQLAYDFLMDEGTPVTAAL
jgi:hypothetical protein